MDYVANAINLLLHVIEDSHVIDSANLAHASNQTCDINYIK